jgi:hypothetical protein
MVTGTKFHSKAAQTVAIITWLFSQKSLEIQLFRTGISYPSSGSKNKQRKAQCETTAFLAHFGTPRMEATYISGTSVDFQRQRMEIFVASAARISNPTRLLLPLLFLRRRVLKCKHNMSSVFLPHDVKSPCTQPENSILYFSILLHCIVQ